MTVTIMKMNTLIIIIIIILISGVYLTTVMTMTSVSVIMSVMVINLYNRGYRAKSAPAWLKTVILSWLCKILYMKHDIEKLAKAIKLVSIGLDART